MATICKPGGIKLAPGSKVVVVVSTADKTTLDRVNALEQQKTPGKAGRIATSGRSTKQA